MATPAPRMHLPDLAEHELPSQPRIACKPLLVICLPPPRSPTHFTFVREKLEEPELPFLPSATPGTFLDQMRVEVTRENKS